MTKIDFHLWRQALLLTITGQTRPERTWRQVNVFRSRGKVKKWRTHLPRPHIWWPASCSAVLRICSPLWQKHAWRGCMQLQEVIAHLPLCPCSVPSLHCLFFFFFWLLFFYHKSSSLSDQICFSTNQKFCCFMEPKITDNKTDGKCETAQRFLKGGISRLTEIIYPMWNFLVGVKKEQ